MNQRISLFFNFYSPPSSDIHETISKLEFYLHRYFNNRIIITGDFNAKHILWGNSRSGNRGLMLLDVMNSFNVSLFNNRNSPPTYCSTLGTSWIDLLFYQNINIHNLKNFKVHEDISLSDHRLISFYYTLILILLKNQEN